MVNRIYRNPATQPTNSPLATQPPSHPATQPPSHPATQQTGSKNFLNRIIACFSFKETSTNRASQSTTTPTSEKKLTILSYLFASLKRGYLFYPSAKSVNQVLEEAINNPTEEAIDKATSYLYDFIQHEIPGGGIQTIGDFLENKIKESVYPKLHKFIILNTSNQYIFLENGSPALKKKIQQHCLSYPSAKSVNQVLEEAIKNPDNEEAIDRATSYLYDFIQHEISGKEVNDFKEEDKIVNSLKTKIKQDVYPQLHSFINSKEFKNVIHVEDTLFRLINLRQQMTVFLEKKEKVEMSNHNSPPLKPHPLSS